jgi:anaphase-promoting complex subunit 2
MDQYRTGYEALKGMRTLQWKSHLGLVEVELELEDRTLSLTVSPMHATAIWHFQQKGITINVQFVFKKVDLGIMLSFI